MQTKDIKTEVEIKSLMDIGNVKIEDGKVKAKLSWMRLWPKNPRQVEKRDLERLKSQIIELGVYKPILVTPDGEVLGGNQRLKVLSELAEKDERYQWVWVSIVDAWTDEERLKYALSDNDSVGKYTREQLREVLSPYFEQKGLFSEYGIETEKTAEQFIDELPLQEVELRFKEVKKELEDLGVNNQTLGVLQEMILYNKIEEDLPDVDIKGKQVGEKYPIVFWFTDPVLYEQVKKVFEKEGGMYNSGSDKLLDMIEVQSGQRLPVAEDNLFELLTKLDISEKDYSDAVELGGKLENRKQAVDKLREEVQTLYKKLFK